MAKRKKTTNKRNNAPVGFLLLLLGIAFLLSYYAFPDFYQNLLPKDNTPVDPDYPLQEVDEAEIDGKLQVHFLSVGQGDAALILAPDGKAVMIDCGPNDAERQVKTALRSLGVKKLEALFLTHPHEDHIGGADRVILDCSVRQVLLPDVIASTGSYEKMLQAVSKRDTVLKTVKAGEVYKVGDLTFTILGPITMTGEKDGANNDSLVIRLDYGTTSCLFMGDAEREEEDEILSLYRDRLRADVIKLGHHGSSTSTTPALIDAVQPKFAVASCGLGNEFGHPNAGVMNRLKETGCGVFRTDLQGDLLFYSDGEIFR